MAILPTHSPLISLAAFGVSLLMLGGFVGGEMSKRQEIKKEIKEIQMQHRDILAHMDSVYKTAVLREQKALEQVELVYQTLNMLTAQEGKARTNIVEVKSKIEKGKQHLETTKQELKKAAVGSGFVFEN